MKLCAKCKENPRRIYASGRVDQYCAECRAEYGRNWSERNKDRKRKNARTWQKNNPERVKHNQLQLKFGISLDTYSATLAAQGGACAICRESNSDKRALEVDHDHATGKVRGLLCGNCNRGIGNLRDSRAILQRAIDYLNAHS